MFVLYGMTGSGNCWKPAVLMKQLGIPFEWREVNLLEGASRMPAFMARNPNGKVPLLETPDGRVLAESNAMLCYLSDETAYLPLDRWDRALVLQWLFFEQYSHEPYIATVRWWVHFLHKQAGVHEELRVPPALAPGAAEAWKDKIAEAMKKGYAALGVMERQLGQTDFLAGSAYTVADIALYAYTHVAHQGGYDLSDYPNIRAWLRRCEEQPRFERMRTP